MSKSDLLTARNVANMPLYDRSKLAPKIFHLGFGAFARAHWMGYHQDYLNRQLEADWGVMVSNLHSGMDRLDALDRNEGHYSVLEHSDDVCRLRIIGSILGSVHPKRDDYGALFDALIEPDLAIVTLTITEKGYCLAGGQLDRDNDAVAHDLSHSGEPRTAIGVLVEAFARRKEAGMDGFTILSLDNLPANGRQCERAVLTFAAERDADLAAWIKDYVRFPSSMVDRIVPALNDDSQALITRQLGGVEDANGIVCEPFRQWVIEDDFIKGRPDWDLAGAQFVADVEPFEDMKLRMLNGAHSFLAYLGYLGGYKTISDCMGDTAYRQVAHDLMVKEQVPTLSVPADIDLSAYADALIARFSNSQLHHQTAQIASDGSQKLPQRMLASIAWHLDQGSDWSRLALGVAGWIRYMRGQDDAGAPTPINDPMAEAIAAISGDATSDRDYVKGLIGLDGIFPADLAQNSQFVSGIETAYLHLSQIGAKAAVAALALPQTEPTS